MAKKTGTTDQEASTNTAADISKATRASSDPGKGEGESVQGYFRRIFKENPRLLKSRSNADLLQVARKAGDQP